MDLIQENINNLTSLWRLAGDRSGIHTQKDGFEFSWIPGAEWPNRLWFNSESSSAKEAIQVARTHGLGISTWDGITTPTILLGEADFELKTELNGMFLELNQLDQPKDTLEIIRVKNSLEASVWASLFQQAFGYRIDSYTVLKTCVEVSYFIATHKGQQVGTAVLYHHIPTVAGIHSMGIVPEMRRKGYARELLLTILKMAQVQGAKFATLQASAMGKGLYLSTGFQEQFQFKTFTKKTQNNNEPNR